MNHKSVTIGVAAWTNLIGLDVAGKIALGVGGTALAAELKADVRHEPSIGLETQLKQIEKQFGSQTQTVIVPHTDEEDCEYDKIPPAKKVKKAKAKKVKKA